MTQSKYPKLNLTDFINQIQSRPQTFLTGQAGTGKSYTINLIKNMLSNVTILSTTNVSAQIIGADTVHSVFKLGVCNSREELEAYDNDFTRYYIRNYNQDKNKAIYARYKDIKETLSQTSILVIDEISMMSATTLSLLFYRLYMVQKLFEVKIPPILYTGDLLQLPPVTKAANEMVFLSQFFKPHIIELKTIHRTEHLDFQKALTQIRAGKYTQTVHDMIETMSQNEYNPKATTLCPTNRQCKEINEKALADIDKPEHTFKAKIDTELTSEYEVQTILNSFSTDTIVKIKEGCRVIITASEQGSTYYNGLQGTVVSINNDSVIVLDDKDNRHKVVPHIFKKNKIRIIRGEKVLRTVLTMQQMPLLVSYAITFHKSQGMSILDLNIDCRNIFEKSMFYVAISRGIDPNHIHISNFDRRFVKMINTESYNYLAENSSKIQRIDSVVEDLPHIIDL